MTNGLYLRKRFSSNATQLETCIQEIQSFLNAGQYLNALDALESSTAKFPQVSTQLLSQAYNIFQALPDNESRYSLYQSRYYHFPIKPGEKVLDIGSGHLPLPMATHLADFATEDHDFGRAGAPFKYVDGKPVYNCSVEDMPFEDQSFDFVYCSHVLEHVNDPIVACKELMRVAKRGYLETPTHAKDLFLNTAHISNHKWTVQYFNETLVFTEYSHDQLQGLQNSLLMDMHCSPQTDREKAFAALILLKSDVLNTMLMWEEGFNVEVRRINQESEYYRPNLKSTTVRFINSEIHHEARE